MKNVMIYGAGVSGLGAQKLLDKLNIKNIMVDDNNGIKTEDAYQYLDAIDCFIKSPGIPYNDLVKAVQSKNIEIIDEIELSYRFMNKEKKIIAITGTNGKTTTTTKICELMNYCGLNAKYAGNIGRSFADLVSSDEEYDYVVLELSSYQLENIKEFKAYISMIINLSPDHLARYDSLEDYYKSKLNILNNMNENQYYILNKKSDEINRIFPETDVKIVNVSIDDSANDTYVKSGEICYKGSSILETEKLALKGIHNLENCLFIVSVAKLLGLDNELIKEFLYQTSTLEHRMEEFITVDGTLFVNDSKGTNVDSTIKAIEAFDHKISLITGGKDKFVDLNELAKVIAENCKKVYLIGETANNIEDLLLINGFSKDKIFNYGTIEKVVDNIDLEDEKTILFSPAHSSFDQFKNYIVRGNVFKELVLGRFGKEE